jgi:SAM-dependent methyltransferase
MTAVPEATDYDTIAGRYAAEIDDRPWNALYERPTTLALLPEVNDIDVLDAGCGHGWYADWLVRHGARVVAVDRSATMVALTQKRVAGRARVIQGDVSNLRGIVAEEVFDLVLSSARSALPGRLVSRFCRMRAAASTIRHVGIFDASSRS